MVEVLSDTVIFKLIGLPWTVVINHGDWVLAAIV
jgi:hypothetical protein